MKKILFVSVWDGGFKVTSEALLNEQTNEIVKFFENDITEDVENELETLEKEYAVIDGENHDVKEVNGIYLVVA